jgi:hypothetical protein
MRAGPMPTATLSATICTHCGNPVRGRSKDDVFPRTLWIGLSKDRPLKVPSCRKCNNQSNESPLTQLFTVIDSRFQQPILDHFATLEGSKDRRKFLAKLYTYGEESRFYLDEEVTSKFVKMFMGIFRHLIGSDWFYLPAEQFSVFQIERKGPAYYALPLPLIVGGPNKSAILRPDFWPPLEAPMRWSFRDFHYDVLAVEENHVTIGLRYERADDNIPANQLFLVCAVTLPDDE